MTEPVEQPPTQLDPGGTKETGEGETEVIEIPVTPPPPPPVTTPGSDEID